MSTSKRLIKTDATMESILEANAVRVLQLNEEKVPGEADNVLTSEAAVCDGGTIHVDDQGLLTSGRSVHSKRRTSGSVRKHVIAQIDKRWRSR